MSKDAELSVYSREVIKKEVKAEFDKLDLFKVGNELIRGKADTLENAMEEAVGRTAKQVCGRGALDELKPYYPYAVATGLIGLGYFMYKKGNK